MFYHIVFQIAGVFVTNLCSVYFDDMQFANNIEIQLKEKLKKKM